MQFIPSDELSRVHWKLLFIYIWWSTAVRWLGEFFHFIKVTGEASRNSSMDRGEEQAHWKGGRGKAHSAELQRVSRVGSMVQRSIHNSGASVGPEVPE